MKAKIFISCILYLCLSFNLKSQIEIWSETFDNENKGYWGGGNDMSGITNWYLDVTACNFVDDNDYVKTVSTSGGRLQNVQSNGEAVWSSVVINISDYTNIEISINVSETGSSTNNQKYVNVFYSLDGGVETPFDENPNNVGNFGNVVARQQIVSGNTIQIIVRINNPLSSNYTTFDNVIVTGSPIPNDEDSQLKVGFEPEPTFISSIETNEAIPYQVLDFEFTDLGTNDGLATIIEQIIISQGENNLIDNWQNAIEGAKIYGADLPVNGLDGLITYNNITFSGTPLLSIEDNSSKTYQFKIYLKNDLSLINDNDAFDFELSNRNIQTNTEGSSIGIGVVTSGPVLVSVIATEIRFQAMSPTIFTNQDFGVSINAIDENGKIDTDFNSQVTLSLDNGDGNLNAQSGLTKTALSGLVTWSDLQYDAQGTFRLQAITADIVNNNTISNNILTVNATSELIDDFEDGNLNGWENYLDWECSTNGVINGALSLKHNLTNTTGVSYIAHNLAKLDLHSKSISWRFNLKNGDWDPSSNNKFWFYLLANEKELISSTVDGYAVGVDFEGTDDLLKLWKITDGIVEETIIKSSFNWGSADIIGVEITRTTVGNWIFNYYENAEFKEAQNVGFAINSDYTFTDFCGLVFSYGTASRAGTLWLDDLSIKLDNVPPSVLSLSTINSNTLRVKFSEIVTKTTSEEVSNYLVQDLGHPENVILENDGVTVHLRFGNDFNVDQNYTIDISNIEDVSGNYADILLENFKYIPFTIKDYYIISSSELLLEFTHLLDKNSAETITNYTFNNEQFKPYNASLVNDSVVKLSYNTFEVNATYTLDVVNITSKNNILIEAKTLDFTYYPGNPFDLVINELMIDIEPTPNVLPGFKYIELYNRSQKEIDLSGWLLQVGDNVPSKLENYKIQPNAYLLVCVSEAIDLLSDYGKTMGVLSESQLKGTGTFVSLYNKEAVLVDYINYTKKWFGDEEKSKGGWSLERIDSENFCGINNNWIASVDFNGGTPGKENSVNDTNPDEEPLLLLKTDVLSSNQLLLFFSKNLTEENALKNENFQLDNGSNPVLFVNFSDTSRKVLLIQFTNHFKDGQEQIIKVANLHDYCGQLIETSNKTFTYYLISPIAVFAESSKHLRVIFSKEVEINSSQQTTNYLVEKGFGAPITAHKHAKNKNEAYLEFPVDFSNGQIYEIVIENVEDLNGNMIKPSKLQFTYFVPSENDIVINELLFNPKPEGVDFVEIFNKTTYPVDLSKMSFGRRNDVGEIESIRKIVELNKMFQPGVYLAITNDTTKVKQDYPAMQFDEFLQMPQLPAFNDDEGVVVLLYNDFVIDEFVYNEEMHYPLIIDPEGVSIERIDPLKPTNDKHNWHSAAETAGFATPANQNSQFRHLSDGIDNEIIIEPEMFSPNNDGYEDVLFIKYNFGEPGYVANISIYDGKGRIVKRIANNELLASKGEFSWDGTDENKTKAKIGIYIVYFEVFNLQGIIKKTKKACVLAGRLN